MQPVFGCIAGSFVTVEETHVLSRNLSLDSDCHAQRFKPRTEVVKRLDTRCAARDVIDTAFESQAIAHHQLGFIVLKAALESQPVGSFEFAEGVGRKRIGVQALTIAKVSTAGAFVRVAIASSQFDIAVHPVRESHRGHDRLEFRDVLLKAQVLREV